MIGARTCEGSDPLPCETTRVTCWGDGDGLGPHPGAAGLRHGLSSLPQLCRASPATMTARHDTTVRPTKTCFPAFMTLLQWRRPASNRSLVDRSPAGGTEQAMCQRGYEE